jgi:murein DD-endopeptidase MepM/ murein hydrolase activator NlpD
MTREVDMDAMKLLSVMDYRTAGTFYRSSNGKVSAGLLGINHGSDHMQMTLDEMRSLPALDQVRIAQEYFEMIEERHGDIDFSEDENIALAVMHPDALGNPDLIVETEGFSKRYDSDEDGQLSAREAIAKALTRLDTDGDTKLCFPLTKRSMRPRSKGISVKGMKRLFYGISDNFGDDRSNGSRYHQGTDIYTIGKGYVVAIADGVVVHTSEEGTDTGVFKYCKGTMGGTGGKTGYITIHHRDLGISVTYAEIAIEYISKVKTGQKIRAGKRLGTARECGMGHFEGRLGNIGQRRYSRWLIREERPDGLVDLGPFLIQLRKNGSYCR